MNDESELLVKNLMEHEDLIAKLYQRYSELMPDEKLWKKLVIDERIHVQWIQTIDQGAAEKKVYVKTDRFPVQAVNSSIKYIKNLINEAPKHSLMNALGIASDLEHAMIEQHYFEVFETDSPEIKHLIQGLIAMTKVHIQLVDDELKNTKLIVETKVDEKNYLFRNLFIFLILLIVLAVLVYLYFIRIQLPPPPVSKSPF